MTIAVLMFLFRKPGTTPKQFKEHYESKHIPILQELGGDHFPLSHVRHYIHREDAPAVGGEFNNRDSLATLFAGQQQRVDCDCVVEIVFEDHKHLENFSGATMDQTKLKEDEQLFIDTAKTTVVMRSEVVVSTKEGTRRNAV